uniref:DUF1618 domain-containing protein n=1 Tax=Arundo donax TaxID=35708 RepID=A0A0A9CUG8_ARUDO
MDSDAGLAAGNRGRKIKARSIKAARPADLAGAPRAFHPDWAMLDCFLRSTRGADSCGVTWAYEDASTGDRIGVGLSPLPPPATSHIHFDWIPKPDRPSSSSSSVDSRPYLSDAKAVAAHRDSILLRFVIYTELDEFPYADEFSDTDEFVDQDVLDDFSEEFFVFRASPLTLTRLPTCPTCRHVLIDHNMGILCREDDGEFAVAHLTVTPKQGSSNSDCPVTADLCCMLGKQGTWRTTRGLPIRHAEGEGGDLESLVWWEADVVVPFGDCICWVDYLRGSLFCDVFSPNPELHYVPLPVDPYEGRSNQELGGRGGLSVYRSVCVTKDGGAIKFVDVAPSTFWFYGRPKRFSSPYATINTWTLTSDRLAWIKDGTVEDEEFLDLTKSHNLPRTQLQFPLVDMKDPQTIYFALEGAPRYSGNSFLIAINMLNKTLDMSIPYTFGSFKSKIEADSCSNTNSCKLHYACNVSYAEPFIPCEFSKYLSLDVLAR